MTRITGTLHEDQYTFLTISRSFIFRMKNVSDEVQEKIKTYFVYNPFFSKISQFMRMWKNTGDGHNPHTTVWRMRIACWIPKATIAHSEYVILIAFPLRRWLCERALMLLYTYNAYLVIVQSQYRYCGMVHGPHDGTHQ